ncbi:MAG: SMC-Scp complex subunit ScpB [Candidatus Hydrogenedentes bacterium]|nr:SMC-Scp complex subunit ScpB [Candidatus Hydrogenedentota bacterium]
MNNEMDLRKGDSVDKPLTTSTGESQFMGDNNEEINPIGNPLEEFVETPSLDRNQTKLVIHSILFISDKPVTAQKIAEILGDIEVDVVRTIIEELKDEINTNTNLPYMLKEVAGGYQFFTRPEFSPFIQKFLQVKKMRRFTPALLETLAIIAYKQPVTRVEVEAIRGVSVAHAFEQLLERNLIRVCGVSELPGRPKLYRTTEEFLAMFGFNSLQDLPSLDELKQEK